MLLKSGLAGVTALLAALTIAGCSASSTELHSSNSVPCAAAPTGAMCIKVIQEDGVVRDVLGYLSSSESPLRGHTWRLVLQGFPCDPGDGAQPTCAATASYPGPTRHGVPTRVGSCRQPDTGDVITDAPGCHDTLSQASAGLDDWKGFRVPASTGTPDWLCVSLQVRDAQRWAVPEASLRPTPPRDCASTASS